MPMNAAEALLSAGDSARTALECGDARISYGELRDAVARAAAGWRRLGLGTGDRVLVFAPDSIDWVVAYLGAMWAGGIAVGLNSRLFDKDLGVVLDDSGARFVLCDEPGLKTLTRLGREDARAPRIVTIAEARALWRSVAPRAPEQRAEDSPAFWIYTSGTTGVPKGVIHAQRAVLETANFASTILGLRADARLYATSKLFFAYALGNSLFAGLRLGATVIVDPEWPTAERTARIVERHAPTAMFSVPTLYSKILQAGLAPRLSAAGVRHFVSAGEAFPPALRESWRQATGVSPVSGFGASETIVLVLYCTGADTVLSQSPDVDLRPRDSDDHSVGAPGRIWVRHPSVALGYWKRAEAQRDSFETGWFSPGDLFRPAGSTAWEFCGRDDDMLKISGQWVSVLEIEQALIASCAGAVEQVAAVGHTGADGLGAIALFAVAAPGHEAEARARIDTGIAALPKIKRPRLVKWLDELPVTATGKLQRRRLRELYLPAPAVTEIQRDALAKAVS
jgi:acyl-coenzyme A synthetase/AMP-(fatty) acid ligase